MSTIIFLFVMNMVSEPLVTSQAPQGIISFELAKTSERSTAILNSWDSTQKLIAAFSLGLDYVFILIYSITLSLGCVWTSSILSAKRPALAMLGIFIAWLQWVAAILDGIENVVLFRLLLDDISSPYPQLAFWCAILKFGIIFAGILWCLFAMVLNILDQRRRPSEPNRSLNR
jgi:hypothetical protein